MKINAIALRWLPPPGEMKIEGQDKREARTVDKGHGRLQRRTMLHDVKDVTFREDACRARKGTTPQVLAPIRNVVVHLLKPSKKNQSRVEIQEELQLDLNRAKKMLGLPST